MRPWRPPSVVAALQGVDLDVAKGELVALVGPNGAGKTTLLEVLADLVKPDQGDVMVAGHPLSSGRAVRSRVGYILAEERSFFLRLSVKDNLQFFAALEGLDRRRSESRISELSALLGLEELLGRRFSGLSRGQKQRVSIARGLLPDPPVLLFDEATRALDPGRARLLRRLVREVLVEKENKAVVFATHQMEEAEALADRAVLMSEGRVAGAGPWSHIKSDVEAAFLAEAKDEDRALTRLLEVSDPGGEDPQAEGR